MHCRVCNHAHRADIEAAVTAGVAVVDVARKFSLSRTSLAKHCLQLHRETSPDVAAVPPVQPKPATAPASRAPRASAPIPERTSAPLTRSSARALVDDLLGCLSRYLQDAEKDSLASYRDKTGLIVAAHGLSKTLGKLTSELDVTDADIVASPKWRALRGAIVEAVGGYPEAAQAVISAIERVEGTA